MPNWTCYENHPGIYREDEAGNVEQRDPEGNWHPMGPEGKSMMFRKRYVTGDITEVPCSSVERVKVPDGRG